MKKEMTTEFKAFIENEKVYILINTEDFDGIKLRNEYKIFHSTSGDLLFKTYDYSDFEKTYYNELQKLVEVRTLHIMKTIFGK